MCVDATNCRGTCSECVQRKAERDASNGQKKTADLFFALVKANRKRRKKSG